MSTDLKLYVFVRDDLRSLTPGKACAQVAHAANLFQTNFESWFGDSTEYRKWADDRGFGTTIVCRCNKEFLNHIKRIRNDIHNNLYCDIVMDPTYPVHDGGETFLVVAETCAFVFGTYEQVSRFAYPNVVELY